MALAHGAIRHYITPLIDLAIVRVGERIAARLCTRTAPLAPSPSR